jgi:hypothetical protein
MQRCCFSVQETIFADAIAEQRLIRQLKSLSNAVVEPMRMTLIIVNFFEG